MDYRQFLPEAPENCRDPDLFRRLNEFHFVRWHPDHEVRREELKRELFSVAMLARAELGTTDPAPELRRYCGQLLIWARRAEAWNFTRKLLDDEDEQVRGEIASLLAHVRDERCLPRLIELACTDSSPLVRQGAATGLGGQNPLEAIPVLLQILQQDHAETATGHTPSGAAATALDDMLHTEWTAKRHSESLRRLPPEGVNLAGLLEQAQLFLARLRETK